MGNKGGGRKGFVKAAAATKQPDAPPTDEATNGSSQPTPQDEAQPAKEERAPTGSSLSLPAADPAENETRGQMLQRHKKEIRTLKDAAKKAGKKHKDEAERLEAALEKRHEEELTQRSVAEFGLADATDTVEDADAEPEPKGPTRAQKRRSKAAAQASQWEQRIAEEHSSMGESDRAAEHRQLSELLAPLGLCICEIPADGHCLYRAIGDQLQRCSPENGHHEQTEARGDSRSSGNAGDHAEGAPGYQELRGSAAGYMRTHASDFEPFLDQGLEDRQSDTFTRYCDDVEKTAAWGGDMELNALSEALQRHIQVHSVGMPPVDFGATYRGKQPSIRVCFLRHAFGLGEHYNSVKPLVEQDKDQDAGFHKVGEPDHEEKGSHTDDSTSEHWLMT